MKYLYLAFVALFFPLLSQANDKSEIQDNTSQSINSFTCGDTITDIDGKVYNTIQIDNRCWMESNLRVSRFNDGTTIPQIILSDPVAWSTNSTGAWSYYNDDVDNNALFGKLYNFYVVSNSKNVCPAGWEVPSDNVWSQLKNFLG